jgi:hypothetical protein
MNAETRYASPAESDLLRVIEAQQRQLEELARRLEARDQKIEALEALVKRLQKELEEERRSGKRQATPFSKGKGKKNPKRPGRKAGEGLWRRREEPQVGPEAAVPLEVGLDEPCCPQCGEQLEDAGFEDVSNTDLPPLPQPQVRRYRLRKARCRACNVTLRARHPDVAPDQTGATAHRVGPRAMAAAHVLHYEVGVTQRKVPQVLEVLGGLKVTQGALSADALAKASGRLGELYEALRKAVGKRNVTYTDTTGWKVGGQKASLGVFDTDHETVYQVRIHQGHKEAQEVLPPSYQGTMVSDRARCYDAKTYARVKKQKCLSHVQKNLSEVLERKSGDERLFAASLKQTLHEAIELWHRLRAGELSFGQYLAQGGLLHLSVEHQLRPRELADPDNQRLLDGLGRQHRAGHLLRFLFDPSIEPTNNRAERGLRPAVVARKVSQCSKSTAGAYALCAFKTAFRTLKKRGIPLVEGFLALMDGRLALAGCPPL